MYSQEQIVNWFEEIRDKSFSDLCLSSKIFFKNMKITAYSSQFNGNVFINLNLINKYRLPKDAVIGILAHELAHQVSYRKRSLFNRLFFLRNYYTSLKKRRAVEKEADKITIQRGYGRELVAERESQKIRYANNKKRLKLIRKVYLPPEEIKKYFIT